MLPLQITAFTPLQSALGGALIGLAAVLLMLTNGRIAGVAGFAQRLVPHSSRRAFAEGAAFVAGLALAPALMSVLGHDAPRPLFVAQGAVLALAGLLVGFGAVWGNGCTSGHGVCGLARFSKRSLVATATFMGAGFCATFLLRHVWL